MYPGQRTGMGTRIPVTQVILAKLATDNAGF
jgi:hypothetical protein